MAEHEHMVTPPPPCASLLLYDRIDLAKTTTTACNMQQQPLVKQLETEETNLLKHLGAKNGPPSSRGSAPPVSPSYQSMEGGNSFGAPRSRSNSPTLLSSSPPAPPGQDERASLLTGSARGSNRQEPVSEGCSMKACFVDLFATVGASL